MKTKKDSTLEYTKLNELLSETCIRLNEKNQKFGINKSFRFTENYDKEQELLSVTLYSKALGHREIALQEFRFNIKNDKSKINQFVNAYLEIVHILMEASLIMADMTAQELVKNEDLQEQAKLIIK